MKKLLYCLALSIQLIFAQNMIFAQAPPLMPFKIGGIITIDDIEMTQVSFIGYSIKVTKDGNISLDPAAETTDLLSSGAYVVDIPIYDQYQTGGATPGETLEIHVYEGSTELKVITPNNAEIIMGESGANNYTIDIVAYSPRTLTINNPDNGGTITPATGTEYAYGTQVTLTATPDFGYVFSHWTGDVNDTSSPTTTIIMDADQTVTATFSQCINTLTMAVNYAYMGSVTPAAGDHERACDADVTITATPETGYVFSHWTDNVEEPSSPSTFVIMDGDQTVTAYFTECINTLTMAVNNAQMGSVSPSAGNSDRACDAVVTITAAPNSGYAFSSWTGDVANASSATTTVTMDTDQSVTANFAAIEEDDEGGGGGGGGGGIFGEISIRDVLGYHFDGYNSRGVGVYMPVTSAYKALKGAQTHVEGFAPGFASFIRAGFDYLEQKAEKNKEGFLYRVGTYTFPVLGKIAEYYLDIVGAEGLKADAYVDTTISIEDFKVLEQQGKAVAPHRVNFEKEMETDKAIE